MLSISKHSIKPVFLGEMVRVVSPFHKHAGQKALVTAELPKWGMYEVALSETGEVITVNAYIGEIELDKKHYYKTRRS